MLALIWLLGIPVVYVLHLLLWAFGVHPAKYINITKTTDRELSEIFTGPIIGTALLWPVALVITVGYYSCYRPLVQLRKRTEQRQQERIMTKQYHQWDTANPDPQLVEAVRELDLLLMENTQPNNDNI